MQLFGKAASSQRRRNHYRSARSVQRPPDLPTHFVTKWTRTKITLVTIGALVLGTTTILPILILEQTTSDPTNFKAPVSLHNLVSKSVELEERYKNKGLELWNKAKDALHVHLPEGPIHAEERQPHNELVRKQVNEFEMENLMSDEEKPPDNSRPHDTKQSSNLSRGVSGLPMSKTPALVGAAIGHIDCDVNVDDIVYWNDPQGKRDQEFVSPFATTASASSSSKQYYLTFESDPGGWNNIRMSMEIIFVLAAATGRTLVLPPKAPFYLLGTGTQNARSFGSFFPLEHPQFSKRVKVITMSEFIEREGKNLLQLDNQDLEAMKPVADMCLHKPDSDISCEKLYPLLRQVGYQPPLNAQFKDCLVFDQDHFHGKAMNDETQQRVKRFCGKRSIHYYDKDIHNPQLIHWDASRDTYRLLNHFYAFMFFTNPAIDNYYKRFVRDFLHYKDQIYCAAGKIVHSLNSEGSKGVGWSSLHIRRGDFQYKKVKLPAEEWYENTKEVWQKGEILFIATDERNKTFFDPIKEHHELRFLDDYWDMPNWVISTKISWNDRHNCC